MWISMAGAPTPSREDRAIQGARTPESRAWRSALHRAEHAIAYGTPADEEDAEHALRAAWRRAVEAFRRPVARFMDLVASVIAADILRARRGPR